MQTLLLLCLAALAFANEGDDCPENSSYNSCGTMCPLTCDNYNNPPRACVLMCNPGCHCDEGYVKTKDGRCVEPENCPAKTAAAPVEVCALEKDPGPCRGAFPRYYHNDETAECEEFIYGGCNGNENNFLSKEECEENCVYDTITFGL